MKNIAFKKLFCFLFCFVAVLLVSCKSASLPPKTITTNNTSTVEKTVTIHDTIFHTEADSSYYKAYLECVNGKVQIKGKPEEKPGKHMKPPQTTIKDNVLNVDCHKEVDNLFAKWKDTYIKEHQTSDTKTTEPIAIDKSFTVWQSTQIWFGRAFMFFIMATIIWVLCKLFL